MPADLIASVRRPFVALVHHPLGLEAGLDAATAQRLLAVERAALALASHVIVTSATTARTLVADFGVAADRLTVAEPGTEPAPRATGSPAGAAPLLFAVGSLVPRKGYDLLVEALGGLLDLPWRLVIAGSAERDRATAQRLFDRIAMFGLDERVEIVGELDKPSLDAAYDRADIFVSASLYEGYGMAIGEAMAHGLALVASTGGAAAETVPDGAGLKVPPGDVAAMRRALRQVLSDEALRHSLAEAAWGAGRQLPSWDQTAERIVSVLRVVGA
jgi:glycosyltransferase involved in cell wall biosynthesis